MNNNNNNEKISDSLSAIVNNASCGESVIVEDLVVLCKDIKELATIVMIAFKKNLYLHSLKQPWFNSNSANENALILLVKLLQLQKQMDEYHNK